MGRWLCRVGTQSKVNIRSLQHASHYQHVCVRTLVLSPGTGADLRRLSHKRAGEILETKFGMDPAVVKDIPRWDRIDAIRRSVLLD